MFVRAHMELFPGTVMWAEFEMYEELPHVGEGDLRYLYAESILPGAADGNQGAFVRESMEHGFLWFWKPGGVHSFGTEKNIPYAVYEQDGNWGAYALPLMVSLVPPSHGVHVLRKQQIDLVFEQAVRMSGTRKSLQAAVEELKDTLKDL